MFERIANGWEAAKSSWRVLMYDKELLLFPVFSGLACLLLLGSFAVPLVIKPELLDQIRNEDMRNNPWMLLAGFLFYFCNYFIMVFFNSGLVACAMIRFSGGNPTVADGFKSSFQRLPQIFAWAIVGGTIGWILKLIEERSSWVGRIVVGLIGAAWTVATYFIVPVLVVERRSPFDALKRSTKIVSKTWGEAIVGNMGIGIVTMLANIPGILLLIGGVVLGVTADSVGLGVALGVTGALWILSVSVVGSALNGILVAALYRYASQGEVPEAFDDNLFRNSFVAKR